MTWCSFHCDGELAEAELLGCEDGMFVVAYADQPMESWFPLEKLVSAWEQS